MTSTRFFPQISTWLESQSRTGLRWSPRGLFHPSTGETCFSYFSVSGGYSIPDLLFLLHPLPLLSVKFVFMILTAKLGSWGRTTNSLFVQLVPVFCFCFVCCCYALCSFVITCHHIQRKMKQYTQSGLNLNRPIKTVWSSLVECALLQRLEIWFAQTENMHKYLCQSNKINPADPLLTACTVIQNRKFWQDSNWAVKTYCFKRNYEAK